MKDIRRRMKNIIKLIRRRRMMDYNKMNKKEKNKELKKKNEGYKKEKNEGKKNEGEE